MRHAIAIFVNEEQHDWHAYAHTILTDNALYRRDLTAAQQANRAARAYGLQRPNTIDSLQSQLNTASCTSMRGATICPRPC